MSRSNPNKKKRRQASKTVLIFGEGLGEEFFLKHLKKLYFKKNKGIAIAIKKGRGGDPKSIVIDADKIQGVFVKKIVVLDNDKSKDEMSKARQEASKRKIELIENTPCLEFLLLTILHQKQNGKNSKWCKDKFESKYLDRQKRKELNEYLKIFPKDLLDARRTKILELGRLIDVMEGN